MFSPNRADECPLTLQHDSSSSRVSQKQALSGRDAVLQGQISDKELAAHIAECHLLMQLANARFRGSKSPSDAAEAQEWSDCKDTAIKARQQAQIERQAEARITNGVDYFQSPAALGLAGKGAA